MIRNSQYFWENKIDGNHTTNQELYLRRDFHIFKAHMANDAWMDTTSLKTPGGKKEKNILSKYIPQIQIQMGSDFTTV